MSAALLILNAGSSSIKISLFAADGPVCAEREWLRGQIDGIGSDPRLVIAKADGAAAGLLNAAVLPESARHGHEALLPWLIDQLTRSETGLQLQAVGHRVVHGGRTFDGPVRVDTDILGKLEALVPLAPLHQPHNLAGIKALMDSRPDLPQVAAFDTAFHRTQPDLAQLFGLPLAYAEDGVLRYGFHGLSYDYIAGQLETVLMGHDKARVIVAHLGHGASLCALKSGKSVATSMGFTALDGLPMGTRTGSLDPGVILYLLQQQGMTPSDVERLLYTQSGLKGLSGISSDMRELHAAGTPAAEKAIAYFCYRTAREIGSLAAALGGLDALIFTAGIGEHDREVRARIGAACSWLGVEIDPDRNAGHGPRISSDASAASAWVIPTNEELVIAQQTQAVLAAS